MSKQQIEFEFEADETRPCRIKKGWGEEGKAGQYFGKFVCDGRSWAIVKWNNEDDPNLFKSSGLEVARPTWSAL